MESSDDDFFDTPSYDDEWDKKSRKLSMGTQRSLTSTKMSGASSFGAMSLDSRKYLLEDTQDMMSSLDLTGLTSTGDRERPQRTKSSSSLGNPLKLTKTPDASLLGMSKRSDSGPKPLTSSEGSSDEDSMHTCSSGPDDDGEESSTPSKRGSARRIRKAPKKKAPPRPVPKMTSPKHRDRRVSKPLPIAPSSASGRGIKPSDFRGRSPPRHSKRKGGSKAIQPPSKQAPTLPNKTRLKPLDMLSLSNLGASTKLGASTPQSVEDFAKSFRTSLNRSREHKLAVSPLNLRVDIANSNRTTPSASPPNSSSPSGKKLKLRIAIDDSNKRTPPASDSEEEEDEEDIGNSTFRAGLRGALSDLIEEGGDEAVSGGKRDGGKKKSSRQQRRGEGSSKISGIVEGHRKRWKRDPAAASYNFSESGAFAMQGFRLKESGITNVPGMKQSLRPEKMKRDLVKLSVLGKGASGSVYKALHIPTLRLCAVKEIAVFEAEKRRQMIVELQALYKNIVPIDGGLSNKRGSSGDTAARAPCPFVVSFFDAFMNPNDGNVSIVMEHMDGGSLQDIVDTGGCPNESVLSNISFRVLKGLAFIHDRRQIHRDIKPSNLLINHWGEVKVSDFGVVKELDDSLAQAKTFVGTLSYMSPERISGQEYSYESDVWSVGLSIMTLALGKFPLPSSSGYWGLLHKLRDEPPPQLPSDADFSEEFRDFLKCCLIKEPKKRPSAAKLLKHRFLRDCAVPTLDKSEREKSCGEGSDTARFELNDICNKVMGQIYMAYSSGDDVAEAQRRSMPVETSASHSLTYEIPPLEKRKVRYLAMQLGLDPTIVHQKFERKRLELNEYMAQQLAESRKSLIASLGTVDSTL